MQYQKYNYWTLLQPAPNKTYDKVKCVCKCGTVKYVIYNNVKRGLSKSCGCIVNDKQKIPLKNRTGQKYGQLTIICQGQLSNKGKRTYKCRCSCGNVVDVIVGNVLNGNTKTCGDHSKHHFRYKDLSGCKFGRLTALELAQDIVNSKGTHSTAWKCVCQCGNYTIKRYSSLVNGTTISCGCRERQTWQERVMASTTHNHCHQKLHGVWNSMLSRCRNPNNKKYKNYGAIGITVCQQWKQYQNFRQWAINNGYDQNASIKQCSLDRINPFGNYCPQNCRFVDMHVQQLNKRKNYNKNKQLIEQYLQNSKEKTNDS